MFTKKVRRYRRQQCCLRAIMSQQNLKPIDLAEQLEVSTSTVWNWMHGVTVPDVLMADDICQLLKVKLVDIYPRWDGAEIVEVEAVQLPLPEEALASTTNEEVPITPTTTVDDVKEEPCTNPDSVS